MEYEDRLTITTPEGVDLSLSLAGVGSRCAAGLVDFTIQVTLVIALLVALASIYAGPDYLRIAAFSVASFLIFFGYDISWEVWGGGRTPGKRLTHLRVVRSNGAPIGFRSSAVRNLVRIVDYMPLMYMVGMVAVLATRRNQRLGDLAADSVVIHEPPGARRRGAPVLGEAVRPVPPPPDAGTWEVSAVTPEDLATVRAFLQRRTALRPDARRQLAADLAARLRPKVSSPPPGDDEQFLDQLAAVKASRM